LEFSDSTCFSCKEEQICDRSFLRPLPDVVDECVLAEIKRQKDSGEGDGRARSKTNLQKRLEAKEAELAKKEKLKADEDEFGLAAAPPSKVNCCCFFD
jgi:hypothetical protein